MQVIYCRRHNIGSLLLRTFLWSQWSHCGIVTPDETVIHAAAFHGVIEQPLAQFKREISAMQIRTLPDIDDILAIKWARSQVGKPYDWNGVIGLALRRDSWQDDDAWFCSELVEAAAAAGARRRFINDARRVTPQHSWMVA